MIIFHIFFFNLIHQFPIVRKGALQTLGFLDLPGLKGPADILERKCVDMRGISG
jgi:hypothetical protein